MTKQPLWEHLRDQAMQDLKSWKPESEGEVAELVAELRHFVAEYQKMRGLDPENIYSIHQGDAEKEAHLRVSRLSRIAELLERLTHQPEPGGLTDEKIPDNYAGHEKGFAQEHLARLMRDAIGTETNHNAYIVAAGRILDRPEFACVARWGHPTPQPVALFDIGQEWRPCVKLPITVHVRDQRPGETHSSTREGITPLRSDDLIMRGVRGEEYPIGRDLFEQTYELLPTPEATNE